MPQAGVSDNSSSSSTNLTRDLLSKVGAAGFSDFDVEVSLVFSLASSKDVEK